MRELNTSTAGRVGLVLMAAAAFAVVALLIFTNEAKADSPSWTGCYGSVHGGYSASIVDAGVGVGPFGVSANGLGSSGAVAGVGAGCDLQLNKFVVGGFADVTWHHDTEFTVGTSGLGLGDLLTNELEREWAIGARAGYLLDPTTLVYGLLGYGRADYSSIDVPPLGASLSVPEFDGVIVGAGLEKQLGNGWSLKGEYRYADYDEETIALGGGASVDLDPDTHQGRLGLSYKFNTLSSLPLK